MSAGLSELPLVKYQLKGELFLIKHSLPGNTKELEAFSVSELKPSLLFYILKTLKVRNYFRAKVKSRAAR